MSKKVKTIKPFKPNQEIPNDAKFLAADTSDSPLFYYEVIVMKEEQHDDLVPGFVSDHLRSNRKSSQS